MSDLEAELRAALRCEVASIETGRWTTGVERRRVRRRRARIGMVFAVAIALAGAAVARTPSPRPRPMFALGLFRLAEAHAPAPDERLLRGALAQYERGNDDAAQALLQRLIDEQPRSPHVTEAAVGRGDHCFERGDLAAALAYYRRAASAPSPVQRYARYKIGWVLVNQKETAAAITAFEETIKDGDDADPVVREAKRDLARLRAGP